MPRINPIERKRVQGRAAQLFDGVQESLGVTPNILQPMAHSPAALQAYLDFGKALGDGELGAQLREQIAVAVAGVNACQYCASAHTALGKRLDIDEQELTANMQGESADPQTQAALHFAQQVVVHRGWIDDDEVRHLRDAGYNDAQVVEIIATVAINIFTNYFNHIAQTEVDFPEVQVAEPAAA